MDLINMIVQGHPGAKFNLIQRFIPLPFSDDKIDVFDEPEAIYRFLPDDETSGFAATKFQQRGRLRIRSLISYRQGALSRRDDGEGRHFGRLPNHNGMSWEASDAYALCFVRVPFQGLLQRFEHTRCVKIERPKEYLQKLDSLVRAKVGSMERRVEGSRADHVAYCTIPSFDPGAKGCAVHPGYIKHYEDPSRKGNFFFVESEYRALWCLRTHNQTLEDIEVGDKSLASHTSFVPPADLIPDSELANLQCCGYTTERHNDWLEAGRPRWWP